MHAMQKVMDPSHPLLSKEVDNIWFDLDMDPDDEADPMKLLREATCFGHEVTWALDCKKKQLPIACAKTVLLGGVVRPQQRASLVSRLRRSLPPMSLRFCFEGPGTSKSTSLQHVVFAVQSTVSQDDSTPRSWWIGQRVLDAGCSTTGDVSEVVAEVSAGLWPAVAGLRAGLGCGALAKPSG